MTHSFRIDGLVALVTGAGSGIGRAIALELARAGARRIYLAGRREAPLAETAALIAQLGKSCESVAIPSDLGTETGRQAIIRRVLAGQQIDVIVNNAGIFLGSTVEQTTDVAWHTQLEVNTTAPFMLVQGLLELLEHSRFAAVVNVSSTLAVKPIPHTVAYNASKAALVQVTRSLALELAPRGIRVNAVLPAVVETPMYRGRFTTDEDYHQAIAKLAEQHPLGRVGQPEDVASAVLYLASPAAGWVTGVALPVDGGMLVT